MVSLTIPKNVTSLSLGNSGLKNCCALNSIFVSVNNTKYDSRDNSNAIITKVEVGGIAANTLARGTNRTIIPATVTTIGAYAFAYCNTGVSSQNTKHGYEYWC